MSKILVRYTMVVCVAALALTLGQAVRAADQKTETTAPPKSDVFGGKIEAVDVNANTITIKHKKESKTFTVAPDCKFTGTAGKKINLANLVVGDHVKVTYTQEGDKSTAHHIGHVDKEKAEASQPK